MSFSIGFLDEPLSYPYDDPATPEARGVLVLGDSKEYFGSSLYEWKQKDYELQWRHAVKALLDGKDRAALITTYCSPEVATHLEWWPMYVEGKTIVIQDQLLLYDQLAEPFSIQNAFSFLRDRRAVNNEGVKISEWIISFPEVEAFGHALSV